MNQNDIEGLTIFAEQNYCKKCIVNPCQIFTNGEYEKCVPLIAQFEKQENDYHNFLSSIQKQHIPGKCVLCRNEEMNDRDNDCAITTLRNENGTIRIRGYLCSYHRTKEGL